MVAAATKEPTDPSDPPHVAALRAIADTIRLEEVQRAAAVR
jgi:hypothetical protein